MQCDIPPDFDLGNVEQTAMQLHLQSRFRTLLMHVNSYLVAEAFLQGSDKETKEQYEKSSLSMCHFSLNSLLWVRLLFF